ncbi:MAG: hypothetical protein OXK17_01925 [Thaumarchaeota archaeon]|nr:hypothetical protein [Nitrososphaerota archaeon]
MPLHLLLPLPDASMLQYAEHARLLLVLGMLAANSYTDVRFRTVWGADRHYAMLGALGLCIFLFPGGGWQDTGALMSMAGGITFVLLLWRCRVLASGDSIIMLIVCVTLPEYGGVQFVPILVVLLGVTLTGFAVVAHNLALNTLQYISPDGRSPFDRYPAAGPWKRAAALFTAHQKRSWEKYVVPVWEDGRGSFSVRRTQQFDRRDWKAVPAGRLVVVAGPVVPYLLLVVLLIVAAAEAFPPHAVVVSQHAGAAWP